MPVKIRFLEAGYALHPEAIATPGKSWKPGRFPASVAVIEHPKHGVVLFDTGYSPRFYEQTKYFPNRFYALVTHVSITPEVTAVEQLKQMGIHSSDVRTIVLSHFHADHVGGVADFPRAQYVYAREGYERVRNLHGIGAVKAGFLSGLLPSDFVARSRPILSQEWRDGVGSVPGFSRGMDLFGDGSVVAIPLPGHAEGHLGLEVRTGDGPPLFLVGDACWSTEAYQKNILPRLLARIALSDWDEYRETLGKIHEAHINAPEVKIVPCHCSTTLSEVCAEASVEMSTEMRI
jgi:glyoxylase-like metal-dependent hydrolase (beta-lactamase superfamily II)